ncbi:hypothetical protein [Starkeya nomas]|uniref:hypothetical protein n=1 Tax=Starkeya nomas TaxID=2666134 RepID=UPI00135B4D05|nr:hypothetical protein [Starkeya nomas]
MTTNPYSANIPDGLKISIADALTLHGHLENQLVELIWLVKGERGEQRRRTAKKHAADHCKELQGQLEALGWNVPSRLWDDLKELRDERNLIGHGAWGMVSGRPTVVWRSRNIGTETTVEGEHFSDARFQKFKLKALRTLSNLMGLRDALRANANGFQWRAAWQPDP